MKKRILHCFLIFVIMINSLLLPVYASSESPETQNITLHIHCIFEKEEDNIPENF